MIEEENVVSVNLYLVLAAIIFLIGVVGVMTRRNALIIFMCVEMMLNSVNLTLVALSYQWAFLVQFFFDDVLACSLEGLGSPSTLRCTYPALAPGPHVLQVKIDPNEVISETIEHNNIITMPVEIG